MGFLDWIGKGLKGNSESDVKTTEGQVSGSGITDPNTSKARALGIIDLERELASAARRDLDVSARAKAPLDSISEQVAGLGRLVARVEKMNVAKDVEFGVIGETMRKQFVSRMSILLESLKYPQTDYHSLTAYHGMLFRFLSDADRVLRDNRYLFHFFKAETDEFAASMRQLEDTVEDLKEVLDSKSAKAAEYAGLESLLEEVKDSAATTAGLERRVEESADSLRKFEEAKDDSAGLELELGKAQKEEERLAALQSGLRSRVADGFGPLHKLLRKYAHSAPKKEKAVAEKYAAGPVKALFESGDAQECIALLSGLRQFAAGDSQDAAHMRSISSLESGLAGMFEEHSRLDGQLKTAVDTVRKLQAERAKEQARAADRKRLRDELEQRKARLGQEKSRQSLLLVEIEEKAAKLLHEQVRISNG